MEVTKIATKTELIIFLVFFYTILGVFAGLINSSVAQDITYETDSSLSLKTFSLLEKSNDNKFSLSNVISGFSELGTAFNVAFFGSFITIIGWIIISSLPTFNGGG